MAIEYTFAIAATRPLAAITELDGTMTANGAWIGVVEGEPPQWHTIPAVLGFTPNLRVHFRADKFKSIAAQQDDALRLALGLLDQDHGDAVFHRDLETGWFVRKDGALVLNERTDLWTPDRLAWVARPYARALIDLDG